MSKRWTKDDMFEYLEKLPPDERKRVEKVLADIARAGRIEARDAREARKEEKDKADGLRAERAKRGRYLYTRGDWEYYAMTAESYQNAPKAVQDLIEEQRRKSPASLSEVIGLLGFSVAACMIASKLSWDDPIPLIIGVIVIIALGAGVARRKRLPTKEQEKDYMDKVFSGGGRWKSEEEEEEEETD